MEKGIESLLEAVKKDCEKGNNCFNPEGCDHEFTKMMPQDNEQLLAMGIKEKCVSVSKCFHKYCDKYKWIIERAKYYSEKTGKTVEEIIEIWENDRSYWYMNYYQDGKQPLIPNLKNADCLSNLEVRIKDVQSEIETWGYLANTLNKDHQESVRKEINQKVNNLKASLDKMNTEIKLFQISSFS